MKHFFILLLFCFCASQSFSQNIKIEKYVIEKIVPGHTVIIGNVPHKSSQTFYSNEIISWNWTDKENQAFSFYNVKDKNKKNKYFISKEYVFYKTNTHKNYSLNTLMGRGDKDFIFLWEGDSIVFDSIPLNLDTCFRFKMHLYNIESKTRESVYLKFNNGNLILNWEEIQDFNGVYSFIIEAIRKDDFWDRYYIPANIVGKMLQIIK